MIIIFRPPILANEIEKVKFWKKKHQFLDIMAITSQILKKMIFLKNSKGGLNIMITPGSWENA